MVRSFEGSIAQQVDQARKAAGRAPDRLHRFRREGHARAVSIPLGERLRQFRGARQAGARRAADGEPVLDVGAKLVLAQRFETDATGHPLLELSELGTLEQRFQLQRADQHDLQPRAARRVDVRQQADLLEHVGPNVLRLVDHDGGVGVERDQRGEKVLQRMDQIVAGDLLHHGPVGRDDPEVLQHLLQEIVAFEQRVVDDGDEGVSIEPLQHGAAEERLAAADLAGDDHQWFPAADRIRQFLKRVGMRCAFEQIPRIGRQAERRVTQSEKLLVTHLRNGTPTKRRDGVSSKIFYWSDSQRRCSEVTGPLNLLRSHRPMPATE